MWSCLFCIAIGIAIRGCANWDGVNGSDGVRNFAQLVTHFAINGGCFFEKTPAYAYNNANDYWSGVLLLACDDGKVSIERQIPLTTLMKEFM